MYIKGTKVKFSQQYLDRHRPFSLEDKTDWIGVVVKGDHYFDSSGPLEDYDKVCVKWDALNFLQTYDSWDVETLPGELIILGPDDPRRPKLGK